ncbi:LacI family DNA-binding transcriptional regulator [Kiloniella sp. EL199]|uniref:LacI family DNA-binding transcriptional regulator n=1 Tax=Kiloniella sp. EL199 TaxID=2107581 RepID=UPI000EA4075C|nr:LacI family DNA-binding transcriptional regulator [Kiloniella sp. EL199]
MIKINRAAKISEIARVAGVSTATVDRVLNNRKHVGSATKQRVLQAKLAIETEGDEVVRSRPWRLKVLLPDSAGPSTEYLASCFQDVGAQGNATIECIFTKKMEPKILARKLLACIGQGIDAVAFQPLDDPHVRDAVHELASYKIPTLALLSGLTNAPLVGFVGIDNRAAGRTAAFFMGRMLKAAGKIAIISGGQLYHSHEDREIGFRTVLRRDFPEIDVIGAYSGHDDIDGNYQELINVIKKTPKLTGVYNVGGGNEGIIRALKEVGVADEIMLVGHNLTPKTHRYLLEGSMDIVIHQNMRTAAFSTVNNLIAYLKGKTIQPNFLPVEIVTRENLQGTAWFDRPQPVR